MAANPREPRPDLSAPSDPLEPTTINDSPDAGIVEVPITEPGPEGANETSVLGSITGSIALRARGVALNLIERAAARQDDKIDDLKTSAQVHRGVAEVVRKQEPFDESTRPRTFLQRRQYKRASHREAKALLTNSGVRHRQRMVWGEGLGTEDYKAGIAASGHSKHTKRKANGAHNRFLKNQGRVKKNAGKVSRSAEGKDIPGRFLSRRIGAAERRYEALVSLIERLGGERPVQPSEDGQDDVNVVIEPRAVSRGNEQSFSPETKTITKIITKAPKIKRWAQVEELISSGKIDGMVGLKWVEIDASYEVIRWDDDTEMVTLHRTGINGSGDEDVQLSIDEFLESLSDSRTYSFGHKDLEK